MQSNEPNTPGEARDRELNRPVRLTGNGLIYLRPDSPLVSVTGLPALSPENAPPELEMAGYTDDTFRRLSFALRLGKQGLCDDVREDIIDAVLDVDPSDIDSALAILSVIQQSLIAVGSHNMLGKVIDRKKIGGEE